MLLGLNACATATPAPLSALPTAQSLPTAAATQVPPSPAPTTPSLPTAAATQVPPSALPTAQSLPTAAATRHCSPTNDDGVSPTYAPNMPVRNVVGHGHVLTGVVRSSRDCAPIANAKLEFWPEEANKGHPDSSRATLFSDQAGGYRFECNPPEHIHMRISAPGYRTIGNNSYHPNGSATGTFDIVLVPDQ
jgi:protocatechuate 3,4-dioxygenase beta subunit